MCMYICVCVCVYVCVSGCVYVNLCAMVRWRQSNVGLRIGRAKELKSETESAGERECVRRLSPWSALDCVRLSESKKQRGREKSRER